MFDKFTPFRCPWDIDEDSVRPPVLSEVRLDVEFFRCNDPVFGVKLTGFAVVVRVAFFGE